jgi:hypothetical protein
MIAGAFCVLCPRVGQSKNAESLFTPRAFMAALLYCALPLKRLQELGQVFLFLFTQS